MNAEKKNSNSDLGVSAVLRLGLILAMLTAFLGIILVLWHRGPDHVDYSTFIGEPDNLKQLSAIVASAMQWDPVAFAQLSILLMIVTPAARVLACIIVFVCQRDLLYVALASFVFVVLILSFFESRAG